MMKNIFFIVVMGVLLIGIVSADIYSEDDIYGTSITNITYITIYENTTNYWDALDTPADINAADITDDNTYLQVAGDTMTGILYLDTIGTGLDVMYKILPLL